MLCSGSKMTKRVEVTFTNNGGNSGSCLYSCSEAVGGFREGRYNAQFISNFTSCSYLMEIIVHASLVEPMPSYSKDRVFMVCVEFGLNPLNFIKLTVPSHLIASPTHPNLPHPTHSHPTPAQPSTPHPTSHFIHP